MQLPYNPYFIFIYFNKTAYVFKDWLASLKVVVDAETCRSAIFIYIYIYIYIYIFVCTIWFYEMNKD